MQRVVFLENEKIAEIHVSPEAFEDTQFTEFSATDDFNHLNYIAAFSEEFYKNVEVFNAKIPKEKQVSVEVEHRSGIEELLISWGFLFIILLVPIILWLLALIDILGHNSVNSNNKIIWLLVIIFLPVLGVIIYWFIGREQRVVIS